MKRFAFRFGILAAVGICWIGLESLTDAKPPRPDRAPAERPGRQEDGPEVNVPQRPHRELPVAVPPRPVRVDAPIRLAPKPGGRSEAVRPNRSEVARPNRPEAARPNRPEAARPNRPEAVRPNRPEAVRPNRPEAVRPNRPEAVRPNRPEAVRPNRPEAVRPNRPEAVRPNRPEAVRPNRPEAVRPNRPGLDARPVAQPTNPAARPGLDARPGDRPSDRPGARPGDRPSDRPGDRPDVRPSDRPDARPGDRPGARPGDRPSDRPGARPGDRPSDRPDVRPSDRPSDRPGARPSDRPGDRPSDRPGDRPDARPGDRPGTRPDVRPGDRPGARPSDRPGDHLVPPPHPHHGMSWPAPPYFHRPPTPGPLFFLPPPPPVYYQRQIIIYPPAAENDGFDYYDEPTENETKNQISVEDLQDPVNRFYAWDVFRYYGWLQQYEPFHPSWRTACDQGIGFAASYNLDLSRYYYFPAHCVRPGTEIVDAGTGTALVFEPSAENQKILPVIQPVLAQEDVDSAWDFIYGADQYFQNGRDLPAEENYARAMLAQPEMPDPLFRLAVIQTARENYPQAIQHALRCLELSRNWPASPFALDRMFGYQHLKKQQVLDRLGNAAAQNPGDGELQMLYGLILYADSLGDAEQGKLALAQFRSAAAQNPSLNRYLINLIAFLEAEVKRMSEEK